MKVHAGLRIRIAITVAGGALLVAAGVAQLLRNSIDLRSGADATDRSAHYLLSVVEVERLVVDAETGLRGYLLTGQPPFLQPLQAARTELPGAYAALRRAARDDGAFQSQARGLIGTANAYMTGYVPAQLRLASTDIAAARSVSATKAGKAEVDAIRAGAATLERLVAARLASRVQRAHRSADHSISEAVVLLLLLTGLTLVVGGYLGHLAVQRERAREHAERTTHTLQQSILPLALPDIPGCELAVRFLPEGGALVGGDFYDVLETRPGTYAVMVGDVCGKGAEAAAVSAMARWTLRSLSGTEATSAESLRFLNDAMLRQGIESRYITLCLMLLTPGPDRLNVSVACGGHPPPILVPAAAEPVLLDAQGDLLGVWPTIRLQTAELELRAGDAIVAFTDGVTDQGPATGRSPEQALDGREPVSDPEQLAARLETFALQGQPRQRDDIAIVALRFLGP